MGASGAVQTSVATGPDLGVPGQLYDAEDNDLETRIAATDIPAGFYVVFTANGQCALPSSSADITAKLGGIAVNDKAKVSGVGYKQGDPVSVLVRGRIWISSEDAVALSATPYARYAAGTFNSVAQVPGTFAGASDSSKNVQTARGVSVVKSNTAAGLAVLQLHYPGPAAS